jgi:2-phospho-L-lactate guanylyltransferase (CobY/MobA/RfbA family)
MTSRRVLVPIKGFHEAKARLRADGLDGDDLARSLAEGVLRSLPDALVITNDDDVARWSTTLNVEVLDVAVSGLNASVQEATRLLAGRYDQLVIAHADLRDPTGLNAFMPGDGVTIVTDQHRDGTPVLAIPGDGRFVFHYGPQSARRHLEEAGRWGLAATVLVDRPWARDVDRRADL